MCEYLPKSEHCWPFRSYRWLPWPSLVEGLATSTCVLRANSLQSCLTLCNPMDCSPPGSSVLGIFQARILEWVVTSSRGISQSRDGTHASCISCIGRQNLYLCATWEALVTSTRRNIMTTHFLVSPHIPKYILYLQAKVLQPYRNCKTNSEIRFKFP